MVISPARLAQCTDAYLCSGPWRLRAAHRTTKRGRSRASEGAFVEFRARCLNSETLGVSHVKRQTSSKAGCSRTLTRLLRAAR